MYSGINGFKKGYQPGTNIVKDENVIDMVTDSHSILAGWRNHFSQLFNVHGVNDVRQRQIQSAKPLVLSQVPLRLRWLLKSYKDTNHQVLFKSKQIKAGGRKIRRDP